ncbi:DUF6000 family protein [Streptomyces sp. NPDC001843]|uniref:DUF6000 family protein n=1 Tax=Streptomyces sp. NPDC001843 TaxID=3364617 RepID=UPI003698CF28
MNCAVPPSNLADRLAVSFHWRARAVTDAELNILFEGGWRERRTGAWLAAVSRRDHFRRRL